ncbi:50S ribosomal protein L11 [Candidatus Nomurabacteria bacterium]|nr:50S ribosomal protein L11 [Candidatus Nomurabacteria bacterium]
MAKKVLKMMKLQVPAGKATPAPPLGPSLGQAGINIGEFTTRFNEETRDRMGEIVPVVVTVYEDRSFSLEYKKAPASYLIMKAAGIQKGSGKNASKKVGSITKAQLQQVAEEKMEDLNANDVEAAMKIMEGSARSMGVEIK